MKKITKIILIAILVIASVYIAYKIGLERHLTLENLKAQSAYLQTIVLKDYYFSVTLYMLIYFLFIVFSLPATGPMSLIGGFLFGTLRCILYAIIAATDGATVSFLLLRTVFRKTIADTFSSQLNKFREGIDEYGSFYLLILHFLFVFPFFVINALAALANVSVWTFVWTTAVGILPAAFIYAFAGQQITTIQSVKDIFSWHIFIAFLGLLILVILPLIFKKKRKKRDDGSLF